MILHTRTSNNVCIVLHLFCCRGVLQALIEKQFPAADRKKVADLFAVNSDSRDKMLGRSSPASRPGTPKKRRQQGQSTVLYS